MHETAARLWDRGLLRATLLQPVAAVPYKGGCQALQKGPEWHLWGVQSSWGLEQPACEPPHAAEASCGSFPSAAGASFKAACNESGAACRWHLKFHGVAQAGCSCVPSRGKPQSCYAQAAACRGGPPQRGNLLCPASPSGYLHCSNTLRTHLQLHFCNVGLIADDLHHGLHLQADRCIADMAPGLQGSCYRAAWQQQPLRLERGSPHLIGG